MPLTTTYVLSFRAFVPEDEALGRGETFKLDIESRAFTPEAVDALASVVTAWEVLASTGALCGERILASESGIASVTGPVEETERLTWTLTGVRVDDRAAAILMQILLTEWEPHRFAAVSLYPASDPRAARALLHDPEDPYPYPGRDASARFLVEINPDAMESVGIEVVFASEPSPEQFESIQASMATWAGVTVCGAYGIAPLPPEKCSLVFDMDDIEVVDERVTWSLGKFAAHVGALDGLANALAAIDQTELAVRELVVR